MSDLIEVTVYFFAQSRELTETSSSTLSLPRTTDSNGIKTQLLSKFPRLKSLNNCFVLAYNEEYLEEEKEVKVEKSDKLAVIPPLSGG